MSSKYDDIINLKHPEPQNYIRMSKEKRAAQFSPFAALSNFYDLVIDTEKERTKKITFMDDEEVNINNKLLILKNNIKNNPIISLKYFIYEKEEQGTYKTVKTLIKDINTMNKYILIDNDTKVYFEDIFSIEILKI